MPSMRDIKEKIASTKQMQKITKAMQMVSAAKLNRAQTTAQSFEPYAAKLREMVAGIAASANNQGGRHPMLESRPVKKTAYLVMTADRGLAGAYNGNVLKYASELIQKNHRSKEEYTLIVTGKVGVHYFEKRGYPVAFSQTGVPDELSFDDASDLAKRTVAMFIDKKIDELYLVYNHFVNAISQKLLSTRLLPLTDISGEDSGGEKAIYEYEPDEDEVLEKLLPLYAEGQIYGALADAKAAEHAARVTAMRNASDNASEIIDNLTLSFNRARQAAITQEISEIVGGAAALE
ncbi:F0F1 ATP synthase subunit gamma [Sporolactobacillus sp. THM7-7]|nr:F0F1 ATP synthase subunit gamma [Sporolactobacillus sp. THM7-7]